MSAGLKDIHFRELLHGSSTAFVLRIFGLALGYVVTYLITKAYGADAMGVYALSVTVLGVISVAGRLGFDTALVRFVADYSSRREWESVKEIYMKALKILMPFCLLLSVMLFLSADYLASHVFGKEHLSVYFRIISLAVLPVVLMTINAESLRGLKRIGAASFIQNVSVSLFLVLFLVVSMFAFNGDEIPISAYVASTAVVAILSSVMWVKGSKLKQTPTANGIGIGEIIAISLPMMLSSSLLLVMQWADTIMLGMFRTDAEVGVYSVAIKVAMLTSISLAAVNSIAAPKFAELYGNGAQAELERTVHHSTRIIFWSSVPLLIVFLAFPSPILGIFGHDFKSGALALVILSIGQFINAFSGAVGYLLVMTGRQKVCQNIILTATVINIVLNAILIPRYGMNGAAIASMVGVVFWNLTAVYYVKRTLNIYTVYVPWVKGWARS